MASFSIRKEINPLVFFTSIFIILGILLWTWFFPENSMQAFSSIQDWLVTNVSWFYVLSVAIILVSCILLAFSRYGDIKLGPDHSRPEYTTMTWFAMLFSTGMGIGLVFYGVAEPLMHFIAPPVGDPQTVEAAKAAMGITFFHWGFHAWAIYGIVGLILGYFCYRHHLPLSLRSALYPIFGDRIYGVIGDLVDIFAIIGTVFGLATSLGLGVQQINSGLHVLFDVPQNDFVKITLIIVSMSIAGLSVASGVGKGIRRLSELNLIIASFILVSVFVLGPTSFLLKALVQNTGSYLSEIVNKTFNLHAYDQKNSWIGAWTIFYWGWWIAWAPFVGLFIARISKGRTIREFLMGVLLIPTAFTILWMTIFGDTALDMVLNKNGIDLLNTLNKTDGVSEVLFTFFDHLPFSTLLSGLAVFSVCIFFITSADSGALVVDMIASGGKTRTPIWQRLLWVIIITAISIILMLTGGLNALQTATIISAFPFSVILLLSLWGLFQALRLDNTKRHLYGMTSHGSMIRFNGDWRSRLRSMMVFPNRKNVIRFISDVVTPAAEEFANELKKQSVDVMVSSDKETCSLQVFKSSELAFKYEVRVTGCDKPSYHFDSSGKDSLGEYFRAEVYLLEGGQGYDIMGWSKIDIIRDLVDQYERYLQYLYVSKMNK